MSFMYCKQGKLNNQEGETALLHYSLCTMRQNFLYNNLIKEYITMHNDKELVQTKHRQVEHLEHLFLCFRILILHSY